MYSLHSSNDKDYDERCLEFFNKKKEETFKKKKNGVIKK